MKRMKNYRAKLLFGFHDKDIAVVTTAKDVAKSSNTEEESVLSMIYAPCPDTRLPDPRLPFKLSRSNQDAVKSVINDFVLKAHPHKSSKADASTALDFTRGRSEQYGSELLSYQEKLSQAVQDDLIESSLNAPTEE